MSHTLYEEAIADAKKLKQMAEEDAKNRIIDAITPRIRQLIESRILGEDSHGLELDGDLEDDDLEVPEVSADPEPEVDLSAHADSSEKPVVKIDPDGPVSVDLGDFEVEFGSSDDKEDDVVLGSEMAELFRRSMTGETLSESIDQLSEKVELVREALEISRETGTTSQKKKVTNLVETTARDAVNLLKQLVLESQLGSEDAPERAKIDVIIKELKDMTDRNGKNIFDFLFEADEDMNELVREEEETEAEEAGEEPEAAAEEAPAGDVEPEVEDAFLSLGDALGLDVEVEDDEDEDEGEDEDMDDMEEMAGGKKYEGEMEEMEEVYEIDENVLRRELTRLKALREETSGVEDPSKSADAFGGGDVEDEMFVDVSEDQLLNALDDELGSVSESVKQEIVRRVKRASLREARQARSARRTRQTTTSRRASRLQERKIEELQGQLSEMNVFNAKLLYANKLMQNKNLSTKQQRAIVEAMDSAKTVREAKLLYRSLTASMKKGKSSLTENTASRKILGASSRSTRSASPTNNGVEVDRWATLAGLGKDN